MWRSCACVVTRGLRLQGRLDVLPNSLKRLETAYGREKNSIHGQQLWWTFLQSPCQLHIPSKLATSVALCCVKTAHFRVAFYCGQPKAHLCNNRVALYCGQPKAHLWMDYLGKGEVLTNTD